MFTGNSDRLVSAGETFYAIVNGKRIKAIAGNEINSTNVVLVLGDDGNYYGWSGSSPIVRDRAIKYLHNTLSPEIKITPVEYYSAFLIEVIEEEENPISCSGISSYDRVDGRCVKRCNNQGEFRNLKSCQDPFIGVSFGGVVDMYGLINQLDSDPATNQDLVLSLTAVPTISEVISYQGVPIRYIYTAEIPLPNNLPCGQTYKVISTISGDLETTTQVGNLDTTIQSFIFQGSSTSNGIYSERTDLYPPLLTIPYGNQNIVLEGFDRLIFNSLEPNVYGGKTQLFGIGERITGGLTNLHETNSFVPENTIITVSFPVFVINESAAVAHGLTDFTCEGGLTLTYTFYRYWRYPELISKKSRKIYLATADSELELLDIFHVSDVFKAYLSVTLEGKVFVTIKKGLNYFDSTNTIALLKGYYFSSIVGGGTSNFVEYNFSIGATIYSYFTPVNLKFNEIKTFVKNLTSFTLNNSSFINPTLVDTNAEDWRKYFAHSYEIEFDPPVDPNNPCATLARVNEINTNLAIEENNDMIEYNLLNYYQALKNDITAQLFITNRKNENGTCTNESTNNAIVELTALIKPDNPFYNLSSENIGILLAAIANKS